MLNNAYKIDLPETPTHVRFTALERAVVVAIPRQGILVLDYSKIQQEVYSLKLPVNVRTRSLSPPSLQLPQVRSSTLLQIRGTTVNSPISHAHSQTRHMGLCSCTISPPRIPNSWIHPSTSPVSLFQMMEIPS